jgi:hypothetical protein
VSYENVSVGVRRRVERLPGSRTDGGRERRASQVRRRLPRTARGISGEASAVPPLLRKSARSSRWRPRLRCAREPVWDASFTRRSLAEGFASEPRRIKKAMAASPEVMPRLRGPSGGPGRSPSPPPAMPPDRRVQANELSSEKNIAPRASKMDAFYHRATGACDEGALARAGASRRGSCNSSTDE